MAEETRVYHVNGKYRVLYERSAVKGIDGFKVEANSDTIEEAMSDADTLYTHARLATMPEGETEVK